MLQNDTILALLDRQDQRRANRRAFLKAAGAASAGAAGLAMLAACDDGTGTPGLTPTPSPTPTSTSTATATDVNVLNYALNLEYLEATFYAYAAFGQGLTAASISGTGTQGTVTAGRQVSFTDPVVANYAREIAQDEANHVLFLRQALGSAAVAIPSIDVSAAPFTAAAKAAGVIPATGTFDPYASDENFLLAAFIFEDVGVTAYRGGSTLLSKTYIEAAAGLLGAEAYHAGLIRTILYRKGLTVPALRTIAGQISDARDSLDGSSDDDQGISSMDGGLSSNIVPTDQNGLVYSRNTDQVHHIVYLNATAGVSSGGFFPSGTNSVFKVANANP